MQFFDRLSQYDLILSSQSPRRQQLMQESGMRFRVLLNPTDESFPDHLSPEEIARHLCREKGLAIKPLLEKPESIAITADTIVVLGDQILNKAQSAQQAQDMLQQLSGKMHRVITGVALTSLSKQLVFSATTKVYFKALSQEEIGYYIQHYQPFDKAGAYGIQEWIGLIGIEKIEGSYYNVVGLPLSELYSQLQSFIENPT